MDEDFVEEQPAPGSGVNAFEFVQPAPFSWMFTRTGLNAANGEAVFQLTLLHLTGATTVFLTATEGRQFVSKILEEISGGLTVAQSIPTLPNNGQGHGPHPSQL